MDWEPAVRITSVITTVLTVVATLYSVVRTVSNRRRMKWEAEGWIRQVPEPRMAELLEQKLRELSNRGEAENDRFIALYERWPATRRAARRVSSPPGHSLMGLVRFFYSPKTIERVFDQMLADFRTEYFEALNAGQVWKARVIQIRYYLAFAQAMGAATVVKTVKTVVEFWKAA